VLETIGAGVNARLTYKGSNWATKWKNSTEAATLEAEILDYNLSSVNRTTSGKAIDDSPLPVFNASVMQQTWLLTERILKNQWRNPPYVYSKIWVHALSGILAGVTFHKLGTSPTELQNR
jgi:ATP-binding cassette subfamily G (WHITE) protein 2 (SNQ2)